MKFKYLAGVLLVLIVLYMYEHRFAAPASALPGPSPKDEVTILETPKSELSAKDAENSAKLDAPLVVAHLGVAAEETTSEAFMAQEDYENPEKTADPREVQQRDDEERELHQLQHAVVLPLPATSTD